MDEIFLQYLWQHKLYANSELKTVDGSPIEVQYQGDLNHNSGPDFFNAKVKIGDTIWAGNVEIHIKSADWYAHNHHCDPAYNNVILHVVLESSNDVESENHSVIPTLCIEPPADIQSRYLQFIDSKGTLPCTKHIKSISRFEIRFWIEKLLTERLQYKHLHIKALLKKTKNDWETTYYYLLSEAFGGTVNKPAFLLLAEYLPLTLLTKIRKNHFQLEALLFGTANLLDGETNPYALKLNNEYAFLAKKFSIQAIPREIWKFSKLRPQNSPYIRIAQFATLIYQSTKLFSKSIQTTDTEEFKLLYKCTAPSFWDNHYSFKTESENYPKSHTEEFIYSLLINAVVPIKFSYGYFNQDFDLQESALQLLENIPAEKNKTTVDWKTIGVLAETAYDSQALIELNNLYCKKKKCLHCSIGNKLIREQKQIELLKY